MNKTQRIMQVLGAVLFFLNLIAFILMMFIYGTNSLDFLWGVTGHFAYIGTILVADSVLCAIIFILPQNWSQRD